jgi:AAA15 family ATPase/GTPase
MLVEFRVKNFRSIRDEQVLSMVASKDGTLQAFNLTKTGIHAAPSLLNSAAIYGANASGKTSIIKAINFVKNMIAYSTTLSLGQEILISPFLLDNSIKNKASEFEITFIFDKERYKYSFSLTQEKII